MLIKGGICHRYCIHMRSAPILAHLSSVFFSVQFYSLNIYVLVCFSDVRSSIISGLCA